MRILYLDLAGILGWACGSDEGTPPVYGVFKLPKTGEDIGRYLCAYRDWLGPAVEELAPGEIVFESPFLPKATTITTVRKLTGLAGVTEMVACDYKIQVREANNWDVREHFVGVKMAPRSVPKDERRKWIKNRVVAECRKRGFRVADDNDADALAGLSFSLARYKPGFVLQAVTEARAA